MNHRATKIVATIGPASSSREVLKRMIEAGVDVVRLNFSHGKAEDHVARAALVREIAAECGRVVAVMADLQGPKIRIGKFAEGKIELQKGDHFILDAACELGNQEIVGLDYKELPADLKPNDVLLLNDGLIVLVVDRIAGSQIFTTVKIGGELSNNKGINRQGGGLSAPALTSKDMEDIKTALVFEADYIAVSFPKSPSDMIMARQLAVIAGEATGHKPQMIAKIERAEAIPLLQEILDASDGIMVARGDLAVEVGNAAVPGLQKRMIRMARASDKLVITATQMMESMIQNAVPTRAEVSDVANAVLDGTDVVMLSAETSVGSYPVETVSYMRTICKEAEKHLLQDEIRLRRRESCISGKESITLLIASAAATIAEDPGIKGILTLSLSGETALLISNKRPISPIIAMTEFEHIARRVGLFWGVTGLVIHKVSGTDETVEEMKEFLVKHKYFQKDSTVLITSGRPIVARSRTNMLTIERL